MTILREHHHDGTVGNTATAAGEGYDVLSGTAPTYASGGVDAADVCLRYTADVLGYLRDTLTADYSRLYLRCPSLPPGDTSFARVTDSGGTNSVGALVVTATGTIAVYSGLSTKVDETAASTIAANTWYRIEWHAVSGTQEVRIYDLAGTLLVTLTGAAAAFTPGATFIGLSWNGKRIGSVDIDEVALGDDWVGPIAGDHPLSGTAAATSGITGAITARLALAGVAAAVTTLAGTITADHPLEGAAAATSVAAGTLTLNGGLAGTAVATSSSAGQVTATYGLAGTVAAVSGTSGTLDADPSGPAPGERTARTAAEDRTAHTAPENRKAMA